MHRLRRVWRSWVFVLGGCAAAMPAVAEDADAKDATDTKRQAAPVVQGAATDAPPRNTITLNPIIISASRYSQPAFDAPNNVGEVNAEEIIDRGYRTVPEALQCEPGVMVQKTGQGQGSPFIRGFTGFRTLFLIDGVRLNKSAFREGPNQYWSTVDPYSVAQLELVKGPSSVLYGSDAIGGTVNAITKSPTGYGVGTNVNSRAYYRVASGENSHTIRGETSITHDDKIGFLIGGTGKWYGDLRAGHGSNDLDETGYDEWDADFKGEYFFNPTTKLVFAYQRVQQNNVPRTHSTRFAKSFADSAVGTDRQRDLDQDRELLYLQLHAENVKGEFFDTLRAGISWQSQRETEDRIVANGNRNVAAFNVGTAGVFVHLESPTPIGKLAYCLEFYHDNVNSFELRSNEAAPRIQGPVADSAAYDLLGIYVQDTIPLAEHLELVLGGRFTYAAAEADKVAQPELNPVTSTPIAIDDDWIAFVGSARLVYGLVPEQLNLFGGASQGFRAPNLSDLTASRSAASGAFESASLNVNPEYYISFEVGLKADHADYGAQTSYFYTIIQDQIIRGPTGLTTGGVPDEPIVRGVNSGDGYVQGVELEAWRRLGEHFTVFGNVTWMEGRVDTFLNVTNPASLRERALSRVQPLTGLIGVRFDEATRKWWAETTVQSAVKADHLSPADVADTQRIPPGGSPDWTIWSIRGGVRVTKDITATIGLENLTNEDYRIHGSGVNSVGRQVVLGVEVRF